MLGRHEERQMDATLDAKKRDGRGKNEARRLRGSGRIPAVVYGARKDGQAPEGVPVAVDPKEVLRILHSESGANTLINLKLDGSGESRVMVRVASRSSLHQLTEARAGDYLVIDRQALLPAYVKRQDRNRVLAQGGRSQFCDDGRFEVRGPQQPL